MTPDNMIGSYPLLAAALMFSRADQESITKAMPDTARELVDLLGFMPAIQLLSVLGGRRLFVPRVVQEDSRIAEAIGAKGAELMSSFYGGHHRDLPVLASVERMLRDNALRADFDAGVPMDTLVGRYRITQRTIRRLLRATVTVSPRAKPTVARDPFAMSLFEHMRSHA